MAKYTMGPVEATQLKDDPDSIVEAIEFVFSLGMESSQIGMQGTIQRVQETKGFDISINGISNPVGFGDWIVRDPVGGYLVFSDAIFHKAFQTVPDNEAVKQTPVTDPGIAIGKQIRELSDKLTGLAEKGSSMYSLEIDMRVDTEQNIYRTSIKKKL